MIKKFLQSIQNHKERKRQVEKDEKRKILEEKVKQGTNFAIREYRDVFRKLAEYDRR